MTPFEEREYLIMATILDPRFKLSWCSGSTHASHKERLQELASMITVETDNQAPTTERPAKKMKTDFIDLFLGSPEATDRDSPSNMEVDDYLAQSLLEKEKNPLNYWALNDVNFPRLAKLAVKFLSLPASSAPVERIFSVGGKLFRPERCRLSDTVFEKLMFIRCNREIIF